MKKKLLILTTSFLVFLFLIGGFFFRFRNQSFITGLTDNYWIFSLVNKLAKITDLAYVHYSFYPNSFQSYQLFIKGNDLEELQLELPTNPEENPVMAGFNVEVPAVFIDPDNKEYKVDVRFRGNGAIHWAQVKKSWRITLSGNQVFNDLNSFDLIIPEDRGLILEHLANFRAKKLGLLSSDSWFINLILNQKPQGIYYVTERLDERFFSRRNLTGNLFGEKDQLNPWNANIYQDIKHWRTYSEDDHHPDFKYLKQLLDLVNDSQSTPEQIFTLLDKDSFLNWEVHRLLMASLHQGKSHNNRLFFNHKLNKFQLVPWDTGDRTTISEDINLSYNPLTNKLLQSPQLKSERNQRLKNYVDDSNNLKQDLAFFNQTLNTVESDLIKDTNKFYPTFKYLLDIKAYTNWMNQHFDNLKSQL